MTPRTDLDKLSDGDLLRAAAEGDEAAFAEFCVRSLPTFLGLLRARCRHLGLSPDLAHDAGQEAILRALDWFARNRPQPTDSTDEATRWQPSLSWLITIAMNVLRDWARSRQRMQTAPEESLANLAQEETVPPAEYDDVIDALGRLTVRDREVLELILIQELTPEEAAIQLGIGKWAGYKRYERALVRLRAQIGSVKPTEPGVDRP